MTDTTPLERAAAAEFHYWAEAELTPWAEQSADTQAVYRAATLAGLTAALDVEEIARVLWLNDGRHGITGHHRRTARAIVAHLTGRALDAGAAS